MCGKSSLLSGAIGERKKGKVKKKEETKRVKGIHPINIHQYILSVLEYPT